MLYIVLIALVVGWLFGAMRDSYEFDGAEMMREVFHCKRALRGGFASFMVFEIVKHWA
ncbi:MAG: hypothetical protein ACR2KT_02665 [Methylocella sp.]